MNFINRVEQSLIEQLARSEIASMEHSFSWLSDEQLQRLSSMSKEDKDKFFASYWTSLRQTAINDITKRLNAGLSLAPHISSLLPDIKKEIRYTTSAPLSLHVFSLGVLGKTVSTFLYTIVAAVTNRDCTILLYQSLPLLVLLYFLIRMVFQFATAYYTTLHNTHSSSIERIFLRQGKFFRKLISIKNIENRKIECRSRMQ